MKKKKQDIPEIQKKTELSDEALDQIQGSTAAAGTFIMNGGTGKNVKQGNGFTLV